MKFPTMEEFGKRAAEYALDEYVYEGKTIREWIKIIAQEDCISRTEVLKVFDDKFLELQKAKQLPENKTAKDKQLGVNWCINTVKDLPSVNPQESKTDSDCISRKEAIKCLDCDFDITGRANMEVVVNYINSAHDKIMNLPSVKQEPKTGWIPVSERLPEIRQNVLCQCRANTYSVLRLNHDSDWECIYPHTTYMQSFVIAWQPLPKPYSEASE